MNFKFDGDKVFFTSDTHFNHTNILQYCQRPFKNVDEMNEAMIARWNNVVGADDIVFHLGDFCLGGSAEWTKVLDRLNGRIYLVLGNHDLKNIKQGMVTAEYEDRVEHYETFLMKGYYYVDSRSFIAPEYITSVEKIPCPEWEQYKQPHVDYDRNIIECES